METIFSKIYEHNVWNNNDSNVPLSGPGSSLENTKIFRQFLEATIDKYDIKSVIDLGCGDCTWIPTTKTFSIDYMGIDIVESVINKNITKYGNKFVHGNIIEMEIPKGDLFIIRDVIFHMKLDNILKLFNNIKDKFKYIMITSCINLKNKDQLDDKYHYTEVNLNIEPFNKTKYLDIIYEKEFSRNVILYESINF